MNIVPRKSGFKREPLHFKDYSHEKVFGVGEPQPITHIGRLEQAKALNLPLVAQGNVASCISCSVTWIRQFMEATGDALSWEWLAFLSQTGPEGATPSQVLEPARKQGICETAKFKSTAEWESAAAHKVPNYFFLHKYDRQSLYQALKVSPLLVGVDNWGGVQGGHMMAAIDMNEDGSIWCVNWWDNTEQQYVLLDKDTPIVFAASFAALPQEINNSDLVFPMLEVLWSKFASLFPGIDKRKAIAGAIGVLAILFGLGGESVAKFGSSNAIGRFRTTLSASVATTDSSLSLSSLSLSNGEVIGAAGAPTVTFPLYLTLNPGGSTQEDVECWSMTTGTSASVGGCNRGMSWLGGSTTSSVASLKFAHAAGETVIQSNTPYFFNQMVDTFTSNQFVNALKNFTANIRIGSAATSTNNQVFFNDGQSPQPYIKFIGPQAGYTTSTFVFSLDGTSELQINSAGTTFGASSTKGIFITAGLIGINASSSQGLLFDSSGLAYIGVSSTKFLAIDSNGALYLKDTTLEADATFVSSTAVYAGLFGDGSDGAVTQNTSATLTRDMYYTTLTVNAGVHLCTCGFRIFAKVSVSSTGFIENNGQRGGDASNGTAGTPGLGSPTGTLPYSFAGVSGGTGNTTGGQGGVSGHTTARSIAGTLGAAGGDGGSSAGSGGAGGLAGTSTAYAVFFPRDYTRAMDLFEVSSTDSGTVVFTPLKLAPGSGSGAAGSGDNSNNGGGGGGSGGNGGLVLIASPTIIVSKNGGITANGGAGGNGGNSAGGNAAGGGGGGGGSAGALILIARSTTLDGSVTVTGGTGGALGTKTGTGTNGTAGGNGPTGVIYKLVP